jgi:hypothetical protein
MGVSQIRDHLEAIGDVISDKYLVTTTLNGFPTFWIPFVQGVCARRRLLKFDKIWEDWTHEESRLVDQQNILIVDEEEALTIQMNRISSFRKNNEEANSVRVPDKIFQSSDATNVKSWDTFLMTVLEEKGKEIINHMWQKKRNLLPQRKI